MVPREKAGTRWGILVMLLVLALLAGGGFYGWQWWEGRRGAGSAR